MNSSYVSIERGSWWMGCPDGSLTFSPFHLPGGVQSEPHSIWQRSILPSEWRGAVGREEERLGWCGEGSGPGPSQRGQQAETLPCRVDREGGGGVLGQWKAGTKAPSSPAPDLGPP